MRRILVVVTEIYLQEKLVRARPEVAPLRFPAFSDKSASEFSFRLFLGLFSTLLDKMQATVRRRQRQYSTNNVKIFAEIAAGISTIKTYSILSWIVRPECPTRAKKFRFKKISFLVFILAEPFLFSFCPKSTQVHSVVYGWKYDKKANFQGRMWESSDSSE